MPLAVLFGEYSYCTVLSNNIHHLGHAPTCTLGLFEKIPPCENKKDGRLVSRLTVLGIVRDSDR